MTKSSDELRKIASRGLLAGETQVAGTGLAMLGVVVGVAGGAALLGVYEHRKAEASSDHGRLVAVGQTLAQAAEELIAEDRLSGLRRMVGEAVTSGRVGACRVLLGPNEVVASSDPSEINVIELPERWASASATVVDGERRLVSVPIQVDGRGTLTLEIEGGMGDSLGWLDLASGISLIGAAGTAVLWTLYRSIRRRSAWQGVVCDAVLALGRGEESTEAVRLSSDFGEVADAWNGVLEQRAAWESRAIETAIVEASSGRSGGSLPESLAGACDALWQGIVLVDDQMKIRYANGAAAVLLETVRESLVGSDLAGKLGDPAFEDSVRGIASGTARRRSTIEVKRSEGRTILRLTVRPVRREEEGAAMVVIEDVTQQRAAEEARHSFVAQAAHELRTPLTNIRLYVEQAIDSGDEDVVLRTQALNVINTETQRLERLVQDMLSVAEIESGSMSLHTGDVRLVQLLDDLKCDYVAQAKEKNIALKFELPPKLPVIKGDRDKLSLAVHNIVGNALKYTPEGGSVCVRVSWEHDEVRIAVEDSGIGIKQEEQGLIFDRFYRAKDKRVSEITGTGLGLTLARDVVRLHGGEISLSSETDKGSTFTIALPARVAA